MNNQHVYQKISEYVDGSLTTTEQAMVEAHLRSCEKCREDYESIRRLVDALRQLPKSAPLPENFLSTLDMRIAERLDDESQFMNRKNGKEDTTMRQAAISPARSAVSRMWIMRIAAVFMILASASVAWFILRNSGGMEPILADRTDAPPEQHATHESKTDDHENAKTAVTSNSSNDHHKKQKSIASVPSTSDSMKSNELASNSSPTTIHPAESNEITANIEEAPRPSSTPAIEGRQEIAKAAVPLLNEATVPTGKISGRVTDKTTGQPLVQATVLIVGTTLGSVTDSAGNYIILNVPPGEITVRVSYVGYAQLEQTSVKVEEGGTTTLNMQIEPSKIELQAVTVAAERAMVKSSATNSTQIANAPTSRSVEDVLHLQAGTVQQGNPGFLRGGRANEAYTPPNRDDENNAYFHTEEYGRIYENEFLDALKNPLSTFSIDVDAASYSNIRRFINNGQLPPKDAVRTEEMINYFTYDYPQPHDEHPFSITTDVATCPWNEDHKLVLIGLQGKKIATENLSPSNLVFLIDVSGSMNEPNKLPLVKSAFRLLVNQLRSVDRVSIVVYAGQAGLVLPSTSGNEKEKILDAIDRLEAGGSTAGGAGIQLAYKVAKENFLQEGNNRVILATDGDFNVGISSTGELVRFIEEKRDEEIFLSVLGFGTDNYKDDRMEQLADKGNGNHFYIDDIDEAKKVFIGQMAGTLFTIAKDVKLQIEFNPVQVKAYRLIGYENRMLKKEDFNNDKKDAGELGAGHTVTALYEIVPADGRIDLPGVDSLKYQSLAVGDDRRVMNELLTVKFRYKEPTGSRSKLLVQTLQSSGSDLRHASANLQFAAAVAEFGMLLRDSQFKAHASFDQVLELSRSADGKDTEGYRAEFIRLVESCKMLTK